MDDSINSVDFDSLDYGVYRLIDSDAIEPITEDFQYTQAGFNKLEYKRLRLPTGKNNNIFILSDTIDDAMHLVTNRSFVAPSTYMYAYYPWIYVTKFLKRRFILRLNNKVKQEHNEVIKATKKLKPWTMRRLTNNINNTYIVLSDIYNTAVPLLKKVSVKVAYSGFFQFIKEVMNQFQSPINERNSTNVSWNNRILLIDSGAFAFNKSAPLNENKTNPLYLFYLLLLRTRDFSTLDLDMDILICSRNMFIKMNPSKLTAKDKNMIRIALFKIMNVNLDEYTSQLSKADQDEINIDTANKVDEITTKTIEITTLHKNISPSTKAILADKVINKVKEIQKNSPLNIAKKEEIQDRNNKLSSIISPNSDKPFLKSILINDAKKNDKIGSLFKLMGANGYEPLSTTDHHKLSDIPDSEIEDDEDEEDYQDYINTLNGVDEDDTEEEENIPEEEIETDVDIAFDDEDVKEGVFDQVQSNIVNVSAPDDTALVNSKRDQKLREERKKVLVQNSTIEEILDRENNTVNVEESDKSSVLTTANPNVKKIKFANFNKAYLDNLYVKDIISTFDSLKDKEFPFYIKDIKVKDTSDPLNYKDTWTVKMYAPTDKPNGKPEEITINVDIPKFINDKFMLINGNKYIILNQNFYNPLVKDTPDTVIITTNYNKITVSRKDTRSLNVVERIFSLSRKNKDSKIFTPGNSSAANSKYISSLEYDEISKRIFSFVTDSCQIYFSREYMDDNYKNKYPSDLKETEFVIGFENGAPIVIDEDTGLDRNNRTIADIIEANLPDDMRVQFESLKGPSQPMYAQCKVAGREIPVGVVLIMWEGLLKTLDRLNIKWNFDPNLKRIPKVTNGKKYIRFADGVLSYEPMIFAELILNGLYVLDPAKHSFEDFNNEVSYGSYIYQKFGSYKGIDEIHQFYEFLVDPITKEVCEHLLLPDTPSGLLIEAVKLLADNKHVSKSDDRSYRLRNIETVPAILYSNIARQYKAYAKSNNKATSKLSLKQSCVIDDLIKEKTVENYSTLNPAVELDKTHSVSARGRKGSNEAHSYDMEKRSYDPSSIGKIALTTSADAKVGVTRSLVIEPTITNARGYRDQVSKDELDTLQDVNIFSPVELLTPGTARRDDPIRTAIASKQTAHLVPIEAATPVLVSNGFDEAVQFHVTDDFVINAEEDGKVVDVNPDLGFVVVQYKSGKTKAINTKPTIVNNASNGFFVENTLTPVYTKVGDKFKKDEPLAYHNKFFKYSKMNGLRQTFGPLSKVAFMSSYNTYEDAGVSTEKFGEQMKTEIVYKEDAGFKAYNNILYMAKVGDQIKIGDPLIKYDSGEQDPELAKFLSKISAASANMVEEQTKNEVKTHHAGTIIDIKVSSRLDPKELSPSLAKIVRQYFNKGKEKEKYLSSFDSEGSIVKAGYLLTDETAPIKDKYDRLHGYKNIDVLIDFYIAHEDVLGIGDKVALNYIGQYGALK